MRRVVVGLGNPGPAYRLHRHNFGARVVEEFLKRVPVLKRGRRWYSLWAKAETGDKEVHLLRPLTYMNRSGIAVRAVVRSLRVPACDVLVVCDDLSLSLGMMRFRKKGSSGGHTGLRSVEELLDTQEYPRLRLGIGPKPPEVDAVEFVLSDFTESEWEMVGEVLSCAVDAVMCWITEGLEVAMRTYNRRILPGK